MTVKRDILSAAKRCVISAALVAAAAGATPAVAQNLPGVLGVNNANTANTNNNRQFHPFSWAQYKASGPLNAAAPNSAGTNPFVGEFSSSGTPMILNDTSFADDILSVPDPLFTIASPFADVLGRWNLQNYQGTQVSGYELGDFWDPVNFEPPYSGNVFRDYASTGWDSPNQYVNAVSGSSGIEVDDSAGSGYPGAAGGYNAALAPPPGDTYTSTTGFVYQNGIAGAEDSEDQYAAATATPSTDSATWSITPGVAGQYELYVKVPQATVDQNAVTDAAYSYAIDGGTGSSFIVNQAFNTGQWYDTGKGVTLAAADTLSISLATNSSFAANAPAHTVATPETAPAGWQPIPAGNGVYQAQTNPAGTFYWDPTTGTQPQNGNTTNLYTVEVFYPAVSTATNVQYGVTAGNGTTDYTYSAFAVDGQTSQPYLTGTTINGATSTNQATRAGRWVQLEMMGGAGTSLDGAQLALPFNYNPPQNQAGPPADPNNYIALAGTANAVANQVRITQVATDTVYADNATETQHAGWTMNAGAGGQSAYASSLPTTASTGVTTVSSVAFDWAPTFTASQAPAMFNVLVYIPAAAAGGQGTPAGITDAQFTVVAEGNTYVAAPINEQELAGQWAALTDSSGNLIKVPYAPTDASTDKFVNNYVVLTNTTSDAYSTANPVGVYAGAVQFVQSPSQPVVAADAAELKANGLVVDNADPPSYSPVFSAAGSWSAATTSPDYYGTDYLITANPGSASATWLPTVPTAGLYSVYAWFPSDSKNEHHVTNAVYTINTAVSGASSVTVSVDQTNGGYWTYLAGPIYFGATTSSSVPSIQLSDANPGGGLSMVADAVELVSQNANGATYSSAVAANISDYPEIFYGYDFDDMATLAADPSNWNQPYLLYGPGQSPVMPGGGYVNYIAATVSNGQSNGAVSAVHNDNSTSAAFQVANPYIIAASTTGGTGATAGNTTAVTQLVYFARNENVLNATGTSASEAGAIYCVDGLTGDIVWKYPDANTPASEWPGVIAGTPVILRNVLVRVNLPWYENAAAEAKTGYRTAINLSSGTMYLPDGQCNFNTSNTNFISSWNNPGNYAYAPGAGAFVAPPGWTRGDANGDGNAAWLAGGAAYPALAASGDIFQVRTVVVVQDDNGKMYCLDAAGNGDGNDTIIDTSTGAPVIFTSAGPSDTGTLQIMKVGSTRCYWCWQPDAAAPVSPAIGDVIVDDKAGAPSGSWQTVTGSGYDGSYQTTTSGSFSWTSTQALTGSYNIFVDIPATGQTLNTAAQYTVSGGAGTYAVDQQTSQGGGWTPLLSGGNAAVFTFTGAAPTVTLQIGGAEVADAVLFQPTNYGQTVDAGADLVMPQAFQLNGATARFTAHPAAAVGSDGMTRGWPTTATPSTVYDANLFIGNSNGVLYSVNAAGTLANTTATSLSPVNPSVYDLSMDPTFPTTTVNWWFNSGEAIQYAPVYDAADNLVITSTYNSAGNNEGRVYAVQADVGPVGNGGNAPAAANVLGMAPTANGAWGGPGGYQYNDNPVPYWSFPDRYGYVTDAAGNSLANDTALDPVTGTLVPMHVITSKATDNNNKAVGILPLGDVTGAPSLYTTPGSTASGFTNSGSGSPLIYITCNDPLTNDNGRIMCLSTGGNFLWSYPATVDASSVTGTLPNSNDPNYANTIDIQNAIFTPQPLPSTSQYAGTYTVLGPFSTELDTPTYFVGSSPSLALITPPTTDPQPFATHTTPVVFAGCLDGFLYALEAYTNGNVVSNGIVTALDSTSDANRLFYNEPVFDGAPIYSSPAVLSGSAGNMGQDDATIGVTGGDRGGSVWVTSSDSGMTELEAAPYVFGTTTYVNTDANFGGSSTAAATPGGLSSPIISGYDIYPLTDHSQQSAVTTAYGQIRTDVNEWMYVGGDGGPMFGLTANATIGGGTGAGAVNPSQFLPPENQQDLPVATNLTRNLITAVSPDGEEAPNGITDTSSSSTDPNNIPTNQDATKFGWFRNYTPVKFGHAGPATPTGAVDPSVDHEPITEWGQTVYIKVFGVDSLTATGTTTNGVPDPRPLYVKFGLSNVSGGTTSMYTEVHTITADSQHWFPIGDYKSDGSGYWFPSWLGTPGGSTSTTQSGGSSGSNTTTTTTSAMGDWVAIFPLVLGNGSTGAITPTVKMKLTDIEYHYMLDGKEGIIRAHIDTGTLVRNSSGQLVATTPIDQATFAVLNPLAIRGAGLSLSPTSTLGVYLGLTPGGGGAVDLGPFQSYDNMMPSGTNGGQDPYYTYKYALGNGNNVPLNNSLPLGGTITGTAGGFNPTVAQSNQTNATAYYTMTVATSTGLLGDGSSGDNSTAAAVAALNNGYAPGDPQSSNSEAAAGTSIPPLTTGTSQGYGTALLNIADRSALGTEYLAINSLRETGTPLGWNDDSGQNGPGSIINRLPWDVNPTEELMGQLNFSPDYPDIAQANVTATLQTRPNAQSTDGDLYTSSNQPDLGSTGNLINAEGTLANTSTSSSGDNNNDRYVNPQAVLIGVNVPRYQPANLEAYSYNAAQANHAYTNGINRLHTGEAPGYVIEDVPHGYIGQSKIYIDSANTTTGTWTSSKAYREVQLWAGVQADMQIGIQQNLTDVGAVPAGFGIENPLQNNVWMPNTSASWSPFSGSNASYYNNWFKQITAYSKSNINLINVHFDQYVDIGSQHTVPNYYISSLNMTADGNTSQSFIPSVDTVNGVPGALTSNGGGANDFPGYLMPIIRSSLDYFDQNATWANSTWQDSGTAQMPAYYNTYYPNGAEVSGNQYYYPGPTWHKPRVGDSNQGSYLTVPDEPHDSGNPMSTTTVLGTSPTLSVAVPMGTPVGVYSQYVRLFEGYDPAPLTSGIPMMYTGPLYNGQAVPIYAKQTPAPYALSLNTDQTSPAYRAPIQTYSNPTTTLQVTVTESRITSGTSGNTHLFDGNGYSLNAALPMVDNDYPSNLGQGSSSVVRANDLQPYAFPSALNAPFGSSGPTGPAFGLAWTSGRLDSNDRTRTSKLAYPYDILGASISTLGGSSSFQSTLGTLIDTPANTPGEANGGSGEIGSWWTSPSTITDFGASGAPTTSFVQAYDPFVLVSPDGTQNQLLYVEQSTVTTGTPSSAYAIYAEPLQGADFATAASTYNANNPPTLVTTTSEPVFDPHAVYFTSGTGGVSNSQLWQPGPAASSYEIVVWTSRIHSTTALMYSVYNPNNATVNSRTPHWTTPTLLVTPAGLSDIGHATLTPRYLRTAMTKSFDSDAAGSGEIPPYLDITFTGHSAVSNGTDVFTSRYQFNPSSQTLTLVGLAPNNGLLQETLTQLPNSNTFQAHDVSWLRDPSRIKLYILSQITTSAGSTLSVVTNLIGSSNGQQAPTTPYKVDPSSGALIFTNVPVVNIPATNNSPAIVWNAQSTAQTMSVTVNPFSGAVSFSVLPDTNVSDPNHLVGTLYASACPTAFRISNGSGSNAEAIAFIDDAPKASAAYSAGVSKAVQAARYWYIYRKTSSSDSTSSTLFMNTRRLTMALRFPIALQSNGTLQKVAVSVADDPTNADGAAQDVTAYVDIDWQRGRIYFPEQFEGLYANVSYTGVVPQTATSGYTTANLIDPASGGYQLIQWADEPYANQAQDAATISYTYNGGASTVQYPLPTGLLVGERTVPIRTRVNEAQPSAFLDPLAGYAGGASTAYVGQTNNLDDFNSVTVVNAQESLALNPHKVWLFWTSNRNTPALQPYPVATTLAQTYDPTQATSYNPTTNTSTVVVSDATNIYQSIVGTNGATALTNAGAFRIGRASGITEDISLAPSGAPLGSTTLTFTGKLNGTYQPGTPFGNIGLRNYVAVPSTIASSNGVTYSYEKYYTPLVDNPDVLPPADLNTEWAFYTGASSIYWEALDPRFQESP